MRNDLTLGDYVKRKDGKEFQWFPSLIKRSRISMMKIGPRGKWIYYVNNGGWFDRKELKKS
jgi:hypothetical protein